MAWTRVFLGERFIFRVLFLTHDRNYAGTRSRFSNNNTLLCFFRIKKRGSRTPPSPNHIRATAQDTAFRAHERSKLNFPGLNDPKSQRVFNFFFLFCTSDRFWNAKRRFGAATEFVLEKIRTTSKFVLEHAGVWVKSKWRWNR